MWKSCVVGIAVAACYRETAAPPVVEPTAAPRKIEVPAVCTGDDLATPVFDANPQLRLRSHTRGALSASARRSWAGPQVPPHVPTRVDTLELFVADAADGGTLALYREPYGLQSCQASATKNCAYEARHYDAKGRLAWKLRLDERMSRATHLEVQDVRLVGGTLYFNEACQSYAREADQQCSRLVALDPVRQKVLWRTEPLVSNGRFRVRGCYIVAGYGFTAEPDNLYVVERATGRVLQSEPISSAPDELTLVDRDRLDVKLHSGTLRRYKLENFEGPGAKLVSLDPPEPNLGYGGAGYGGSTYGTMRP